VQPVAVVAPIDGELLDQPHYRAYLIACLQHAVQHETFRLYLHAHRNPFAPVSGRSQPTPLLADVLDTVHVPQRDRESALPDIDSELSAFLNRWRELRDTDRYRRCLRQAFAWPALASLVIVVASVALAAMGLRHALAFSSAPSELLVSADVLALGLGVFVSTVTLTALSGRVPPLVIVAGLGASAYTQIRLDLPHVAMLLGAIVGLMGQYARQRWIRLVPVTLLLGNSDPPAHWVDGWLRPWLRMLSGSLHRAERRVFLSYARRSPEVPTIERISSRLREHEVDCFMDVQDIELGSCWRHALEEGIRRSSHFLFFEPSPTGEPPRLWHRGELQTAARMQARFAMPHMSVIAFSGGNTSAAANRGEAVAAGTPHASVRVIPLEPDDVERFAVGAANMPWGPADSKRSPAWEAAFVWPIHLLTMGFMSVVMMIANVSFTLVAPAVLAVLKMNLLGFGGSLALSRDVIGVLAFLSAGFGLRALVHARFEAELAPIARVTPYVIRLILCVTAGVAMLWNSSLVTWSGAALALVAGALALDYMVLWGKSEFPFALRPTLDRI
jgi:hypothetical protein